jgi:hypothetical protein
VNTTEAKNFLVQQVAEQAALERVSLSDIEKRMLWFTESDPVSCSNPIELNDEFEKQCDTAEYERKMSGLFHDAYKRLKSDNPDKAQLWTEAVHFLNQGDHYILVMCDVPHVRPAALKSSTRDWVLYVAIGLAVAGAAVSAGVLLARYGTAVTPYKRYVQLGLLALMLFGYLYSVIPRWKRNDKR